MRAGSDATGRCVGILADLQGPKIRLGEFPGGPVRLSAGDEFIITTEDIPGNQHEASTTYEGLADDVRAGDRILIDDGNVQLDVTGVSGNRVYLRVVVGGKISDHKGINLPGVNVSAPALHRQGRGRPPLGPGHRRGHGRDVLRPLARTTRTWPARS